MHLRKLIALLIIIAVTGAGCIKQIEVDTRYEGPVLVVEGAITTDTVPYKVKVTYTRPVTPGDAIPEEYLERDALVSISDDLGSSTQLVYKGQGNYETTNSNYIGKVGRSYQVTVQLKNGKKFVSVPEKIRPAVPIDKTTILFDPEFNMFVPSKFSIYIDVTDPANQEDYYNWAFSSYVPRVTHGISCGNLCVFGEYCYQRIKNDGLNVFSDASINGNKLTNRLMGLSPIYWYGNHYIDIAQHSISREEYQFSVKYNEQQTRTGSILDPLPASIKGNIYNAANPDEFALGYFSASSVTHKLVVLVPFNITQYQLDLSALHYIPDGPHICFEYFENALPYDMPPARQNPPPPGWENAEVIEVHW
jgi:uncharacterized protein YlzI (FlbEa/FlbD family)